MVGPETLGGIAALLSVTWAAVRLIEAYVNHRETWFWREDNKHLVEIRNLKTQIEELKKERDKMMAYFFPDKEEVATKEAPPVKKKRGRPRKR
jgi:hypothetical protein